MRVNEKDMEHPRFWAFNRVAQQQVGAVLDIGFAASMTDREAKAVDDAVGALTKVLLMQAARAAAEVAALEAAQYALRSMLADAEAAVKAERAK